MAEYGVYPPEQVRVRVRARARARARVRVRAWVRLRLRLRLRAGVGVRVDVRLRVRAAGETEVPSHQPMQPPMTHGCSLQLHLVAAPSCTWLQAST